MAEWKATGRCVRSSNCATKLVGKIAASELHPIAAWMPAIPDTIRRLIISFSRYDIVVVGALKENRYPRTWQPRSRHYVCTEKGMHSNDIASCSRERDTALVTLRYHIRKIWSLFNRHPFFILRETIFIFLCNSEYVANVFAAVLE